MSGLDKAIKFTKIPNLLIDHYLRDLSGSETVVLLHIARNTWGFQKEKDKISHSQFRKKTGLARNTIRKAIDNLVEKGLLQKKIAGSSYKYEIKQDIFKIKAEKGEANTDRADVDTVNSADNALSEIAQAVGQAVTLQKSITKENEINTTNSENSSDSDWQEIIEAWNERFHGSIKKEDHKIKSDVKQALDQFSKDDLVRAMDNRLQSPYYKNEKPYLLHRPDCFFGYMDTIRNDLQRGPKNIYTYDEMVAMVTEKNYKNEDFKIRKDLSGENGNPKWEYIAG